MASYDPPSSAHGFVHSGHLVNKGSVDGFYCRPPKRKLDLSPTEDDQPFKKNTRWMATCVILMGE